METKLTAKKILEHEFKTGVRGYKPDEVDHFLDEIIQDYEAFNQRIAALQEENHRLQAEIEELSSRPAAPQPQAGTTNFDILKRLSNLERHVFGSKLDGN
ncbi:cell division regulator GpsB [Edaphobacillus lindanitolerans]|uniref:Cell cycle protein GpsB n=1 Tax=Edaphobacillus lindanitolerans TaxID=550447 RepID=A0A1U7PIM5_9BACI|nr:cell division regulator GpsB [Edaphobacillus lindanitolerans]SIT66244.1 DivIVA domain-containing protein [Edaphobacillus lindanitolerans]